MRPLGPSSQGDSPSRRRAKPDTTTSAWTEVTAWHAEWAWLGIAGGLRPRVLLEAENGRLLRVTPEAPPPSDAVALRGLVIPGLASAHSHAFQRALRGRTEGAMAGSFWTWRDQMYRVATEIGPDLLPRLAAAVYGEMALAGITAVGEFHYLHHQPDGRPYADANAMGEALIGAAGLAGIRITLLDTCYLRGGLDGRPLEGAQRRFGDGSVEAWVQRVGLLRDRVGDSQTIRVGAAIHSVRAVDQQSISTVAEWAAENGAPLHFHLSEQQSETSDCLAATGMSPASVLAEAGALRPAATAIHGTHLSARDIALLGHAGTAVCLCPTTERDLGDGVGPSVQLAAAGVPLSLGSDSNSVIDLFEEARAVELDDRLVSGRRGNHSPEALLGVATAGGMDALGWEGGTLEPGRLADFVALDLDSVRLAGWAPPDLVAQVVFAATAADVRDVVVGGRQVVADRRHTLLGDVPELLRGAIAEAWRQAKA